MFKLVVYFVCFDMKEPIQVQIQQIAYWLDFLNSTLSLPPRSVGVTPTWCIIIVGLRSDQSDPSMLIKTRHLEAWQQKYPRLVIMNKLFIVSALKSDESVQLLQIALELECDRIFNTNSVKIPRSYKSIMHTLENRPVTDILVPWKILLVEQQTTLKIAPTTFFAALQYLHAIGRIVLLKNGMVCTDPQLVPQMAAQFISPEEVQINLLKDIANVQILTKQEVGCVLRITMSNDIRFDVHFFLLRVIVLNKNYRLLQGLELMKHLSVCYELQSNTESLLYLFPSLALDVGIIVFFSSLFITNFCYRRS